MEYVVASSPQVSFDVRSRLKARTSIPSISSISTMTGGVSSPTTEVGEKVKEKRNKGKIWWSNGTFFVSLHVFAVYGALSLSPISSLDYRTLTLCFISWQLASFGITIGYHRLWSHRAFTATTPLRIVLAWMGSMGFQGSIRWWVLRHRLHHRFTDSPQHDPYAATNGLWYSHCGWIFRKPAYPRMKLVERTDLEEDPVVRFQHKHYVPIALFSGLILPALIAHLWGDALGGLVWGGAVARLLIWHTTFCINSLAHWTGLRPYTEEVTAKGNYLLALFTSGEGNHNFHHAFPKDYRNGPHPADWDPTKWIIYILHHYTPFIPSIAQTPESAIFKAQATVLRAEADRLTMSVPKHERVREKAELPVWSKREVMKRHGEWIMERVGEAGELGRRRRRVLLLVEGCLVDVGGYLDEHPGGQHLLLIHAVAPLPSNLSFTAPISYDPGLISPGGSPLLSPQHDSGYSSFSSAPSSVSGSGRKRSAKSILRLRLPSEGQHPVDAGVGAGIGGGEHREGDTGSSGSGNGDSSDLDDVQEVKLKDSTKAFFGGMNNHSGAAKERMRCLRVAVLASE